MGVGDGDETYQPLRLDLRVDAVAYINHLSGLNRPRKAMLLLRFPPLTDTLTSYPFIGSKGEAWSHLQACRNLRQGVPRRRA